MPAQTKRRFLRFTWGRLAVIAFLLLAGSTVVWWYVQSTTLRSELNALRVQGLPTNGTELNEYYQVPAGTVDTTSLWMQAIAAAIATNSHAGREALPLIGDGSTPIPLPGNTWGQLDQCRAFLTNAAKEMQDIRRACEAGGCVAFPVDFRAGIAVDLTQIQDCRSIARLLVMDAYVAAHDGDASKALDDIKGILALSNALQAEPTMISQMVRVAVSTIACLTMESLMPACDWSDADLMSLQEALRAEDFQQTLRTGLIGERAICLLEIKRMTPGILYRSNAQMALEIFARMLEGLSEDWPVAIKTQAEIAADINARAKGAISRLRYVTATLLLPANETIMITGARAVARQRCLICAIAAERHRKLVGEYPTSLNDIDVELFAPTIQQSADTTDPFNGQPLKYSVTAEGVLIYSVGRDMTDDGGKVSSDHPRQQPDVGVLLRTRNPPKATVDSP
jgi:hypothetical protein